MRWWWGKVHHNLKVSHQLKEKTCSSEQKKFSTSFKNLNNKSLKQFQDVAKLMQRILYNESAIYFHSAFGCKPGHFLGLWKVLILMQRGKRGVRRWEFSSWSITISFPPLFLNWAAYQKFKVFRRFSNQLGSVSMNWVGEWDISAEEYPESFYSESRPVFKTGMRPTNQTLQPKNKPTDQL